MSTKKKRLVLMIDKETKQRIKEYKEKKGPPSISKIVENMIKETTVKVEHSVTDSPKDEGSIKTRVVVYMDHSTFETLEEYSHRTGLNRSAVAEKLILEYLDNYEIWMAPERVVQYQ